MEKSAANAKADKSQKADSSKDSALRIRPVGDKGNELGEPLRGLVPSRGCRDSACSPSMESVGQRMAVLPAAQRRQAAMALQRSRGNRFVQAMAGAAQVPVQAKMMAGAVRDEYKQAVQRQADPELEGNDEEGVLQGKFGSNAFSTQPMQANSEPQPNSTGMPDRLKAGIESLSGIDMSDVRVHANSDRPARLNALAYTQGNQIYLGPGQERHLPHEAWHAVQQKQGRVRATIQLQGVGVNDEAELEGEADWTGNKAMLGGTSVITKDTGDEVCRLDEIETQEEYIDHFLCFKDYTGPDRETEIISNTVPKMNHSVYGIFEFPMHYNKRIALNKPTGQFAVQRKLIIGESRLTNYNFKVMCENTNGKFHKQWIVLSDDEKSRVKILIDDMNEYEVASLRDALSVSDPKKHEPSPSISPETLSVGGITYTILNKSGGYHIILQHPDKPDFVIRARKSNEATSIEEGLRNRQSLDERLKKEVRGVVRVPDARQFNATGMTCGAYEVEKVTGVIDALEMWNELNSLSDSGKHSERAQILRRQLDSIFGLFQRNIMAAMKRQPEPFPDFRPANVGAKEGASDIVYIDFDQRGEVKDLETLIDQAMEWAGRRYKLDPGGTREPNEELFKKVTGGLLGEMYRGEMRQSDAERKREAQQADTVRISRRKEHDTREVFEETPISTTTTTTSATTQQDKKFEVYKRQLDVKSEAQQADTASMSEKRQHYSREVLEETPISTTTATTSATTQQNKIIQDLNGYWWKEDLSKWWDHISKTWRPRIEKIKDYYYDWYTMQYL